MSAAPGVNLDAEQGLLGAILYDNDNFKLDCGCLKAEHFSEPVHQRIFEVCAKLIRADRAATPITVREYFAGTGALEDIGGPSYLLTLLQNAAKMSAHVREYAALITTNAARRAIIQAAKDIQAEAVGADAMDNVCSIVTRAEATMRAIDTGCGATTALAIDEIGERYLASLAQGSAGGLKTTYTALDKRHGSFQPGELIILPGETASGKTTFATNLARRWSGRGKKGHFASYEMGDSQIIPRFWSAISFEDETIESFPYNKLRHDDHGITRETIARCQMVMRSAYRSLRVDVSPPQTIYELEGAVRQSRKAMGGLDFVIVDYLHLMRASGGQRERHLQIAEITFGLKDMARRLGVVVVALAQINREVGKRPDRRPRRDDMRESASIEHDADIIIGIYRPARELEIELQSKQGLSPYEFPDHELFELEDKIERLRPKMEAITLKARQGPEGTDHLKINLPHDTISDDDTVQLRRRTRGAVG